MFVDVKMAKQECCACDCIENNCSWRYGGTQVGCMHYTCVMCPPCGCANCCGCQEEILYMDGDLKPIPKPMTNLVMELR